MRSTRLKAAGYLLCLAPQCLLVLGTETGCPWLSVLFFFLLLPVLRKLVGNDLSPPVIAPSRLLSLYLQWVPRLYCAAWAVVLPWVIWTLAKAPMAPLQYIGFAFSLWIVCSLNTAIAHELSHAPRRLDRLLAEALDASVGYFHFAEEHASHHARNGHYHGGDVAHPGTSIFVFAARRFARSMLTAWEWESRLRRRGQAWQHSRLLCKALIPIAIGLLFVVFAGLPGLAIYLFEVAGAAFTVQAITYLQHWGLSALKTPELDAYGYAWEDGCWLQACTTLNHAYHGQHHLNLRMPYYQLNYRGDCLLLPASYPVMFLVALVPPVFERVMQHTLAAWIAHEKRDRELQHEHDCLGVNAMADAVRKKSQLPE